MSNFHNISVNYISEWRLPNKKLGWIPRPNAAFEIEWYKGIIQKVTTNKYGLRESKNPKDLDLEKNVVLLQGDSNIFGYGIQPEELVSYHLKMLLQESAQGQEVINAGCSGYDLQHYVLQIEKLYDLYKPRYIFIIFNMDNDILASMMSTSYLVSRPHYDLDGNQLIFNKAEYRVPGQFYGLKFVDSLREYNHYLDVFFSRKNRKVMSGIWGNSFLAYEIYTRMNNTKLGKNILNKHKKKTYSEKEYKEARFLLSYSIYLQQLQEPYKTGMKLISRLFNSYKQWDKSKTVVVLLPGKTELLEPKRIREEASLLLGKEVLLDTDRSHKMIKSLLDAIDMEYIDLKPIFIKHRDKEKLFLDNNVHISPAGHKLLAEEAFSFIKKHQKVN